MAILIVAGTINALMYILSLYFQDPAGFGMSALEGGVATLPAAAAMIAITPLITPLAVKIGTRLAIAGGFGLAAAGFAVLALVDASWTYAVFVIPLAVLSAGLGLANGPASSASTSATSLRRSRSARPPASRTWPATWADRSGWRPSPTIYNGVIQDRTGAGESPADALAAGLSRASLFLAICAAAGIALALLVARTRQDRPKAIDRAAAAAAATHTIPTRALPAAAPASADAASPGTA